MANCRFEFPEFSLVVDFYFMDSKFLVDENCAQLTKWLRFFGIDTSEVRGLPDPAVSRLALKENRILITRDQRLANEHPGPAILELTDNLREQLKLIFQKTQMPPEAVWFTRCGQCNVKLELLPKSEVNKNTQIPEKVLKYHSTFWHCPICGKVYWEGSHYNKAQEFLREVAGLT